MSGHHSIHTFVYHFTFCKGKFYHGLPSLIRFFSCLRRKKRDNEKPYKNTIDSYIAYKNRYKKNFTSAPL